MDIRRISTIALNNRDFDSLQDKLDEACRWISLAAKMGSKLAVLPELMTKYYGDGPGYPNPPKTADLALDDWQKDCGKIIDCAKENKIAVTVPILLREAGNLYNCFYLVSSEGEIIGRYVKSYPTDGERDEGIVQADDQQPLDWKGVGVGGAICFDMNFRELFEEQHRKGARLFLCPSLFPGGDQVVDYARDLRSTFVISYPAWSRIIDMMGHTVAEGGYRYETLRFGFGVPVFMADINFDRQVFHFDYNQEKIEGLLRHYGDQIRITFDQYNVQYALESRSDTFTVDDVVKEFELETMSAYMERSLKLKADHKA